MTATATAQEVVVDKQVVPLAVEHNQDGREVFTGYATARVDARWLSSRLACRRIVTATASDVLPPAEINDRATEWSQLVTYRSRRCWTESAGR